MNESKQRQLLDGQSAVARKVFERVPIQEAWAESEIVKALRSGSIGIAAHGVRGCLLDMKDAGLVKEPRKGWFQRVPVGKKEIATLIIQRKTIEKEFAMPTTTTKTATPLDLLGAVATDLNQLSSEFTLRMKALATRVEEVALTIEAQREADSAATNKAHQLMALLKDAVNQ